jgi:alginate O-acetyltransferase complex protein AlgI
VVFSSHIFLFYFLPAALLLYYAAPRRLRHLTLTILSYVFYGWTNPLFVLLLFISTLIDYVCGLVIAYNGWNWRGEISQLLENTPRTRIQRAAVIASICSNLSLLGFFKYFNFALANVNALARWLGWPGLETTLKVTLPLGISFYTFQSMSYTLDVYRGHARALRNFTDFACYVSMFSQLVAGPIIRFEEVADQFRSRTHTLAKFARGVAFLSLGLAKKILLANPCGKIADVVFGACGATPGEAWWGLLAYSFQIYFDFSGYSDMAIGLGLMMGFVFPKNFDSPYLSQSITEFWRRWHISLSTWLRDYLYIPLGGNRKGARRTYFNLAIVMLLGGLWHGAAWNFVVWGALHGLLLAAERAHGKTSLYDAWPPVLRRAATFLIVMFTWVFFRSPDLASAVRFLGMMFGTVSVPDNAAFLKGIVYQPYYVLTMLGAAIITWSAPQTWDWSRQIGAGKALVIILLLAVSIMVLATQAYNPFIYFIF